VRNSNNRPYFSNTHTTGDFILPFDLSYEVDLWGRIGRSITAAGEEAQATHADLQTASLSLHAELAIDYIELRAADAQQQLLDDTVNAYADALRLTRNRVAGGAAPESDAAEAETQLDTTRVQATDIAAQRAQFEHAIAVLIGKRPAVGIARAPPRYCRRRAPHGRSQ
jgi:outer membrane protein TolC